jgi:hypothetical protein
LVSSPSSRMDAQFELHRDGNGERGLANSSARHMSSSEEWRGRLKRRSCSTPGSASHFSCFWLGFSQVSTSRLRTSCALSSHRADRPDRQLGVSGPARRVTGCAVNLGSALGDFDKHGSRHEPVPGFRGGGSPAGVRRLLATKPPSLMVDIKAGRRRRICRNRAGRGTSTTSNRFADGNN